MTDIQELGGKRSAEEGRKRCEDFKIYNTYFLPSSSSQSTGEAREKQLHSNMISLEYRQDTLEAERKECLILRVLAIHSEKNLLSLEK